MYMNEHTSDTNQETKTVLMKLYITKQMLKQKHSNPQCDANESRKADYNIIKTE